MWRPIPPPSPDPRAGNSAPRQRAGWVGAKGWEGHGHDTLLTDSSSSAERVLGSEGVTVLVYLVVGIPRLLPMLQNCFVCNSRSTGSSNSLCTGSAKAGTSSRRRTGERKRESLHTRSLPDFSRRNFTCYA
jgi:hypothetical protein